jgi:hypothetical protein
LTVAVGGSLLAHGIHYALVIGGVVGLGVLLLPQLLERSRSLHTVTPSHAVLAAAYSSSPHATTRPRAGDAVPALVLPLAVVSMLAAAGVHAVVGPAHFSEGLPVGLFFAGCTALQLAWCVAVSRRPSTLLLQIAIAGNLAILALWALTRTVGLPGVLAGPEPVGAPDLACGGWELVAVAACAWALVAGCPRRTPGWSGWHPAARTWLVISIAGLVGLAATGASA